MGNTLFFRQFCSFLHFFRSFLPFANSRSITPLRFSVFESPIIMPIMAFGKAGGKGGAFGRASAKRFPGPNRTPGVGDYDLPEIRDPCAAAFGKAGAKRFTKPKLTPGAGDYCVFFDDTADASPRNVPPPRNILQGYVSPYRV